MASWPQCRICLDELAKPVSLPCGHIFCGACIVNTVQAVKPYTHMHPCPICRSIYNIAPVNLNVVPPNLRPFVTPSVRKLFLNKTNPPGEVQVKEQSEPLDTSSELSRLRAENIALRNTSALWRRRAEMHGTANVGLINFVRAVRDQVAILARDRDDLRKQNHSLKRKIEDDEISKSEVALTSFRLSNFNPDVQSSGIPDPDSLLFAPSPLLLFNERVLSEQSPTPQRTASVDGPSSSSMVSERPAKKIKTNHPPGSVNASVLRTFGTITENIAERQREVRRS